MNLADALSGKGGLDGVRWLLLGPAARRQLRHVLAALLDDRHTLGPVRLRRAKFKPGRKLTAYFDAQFLDRHGRPRNSRPVAVTWTPDGQESRSSAQVVAELQAEAVRMGLAAPFRGLEAELPDWGMRMLVSPLDERFPQLSRLSDPGYVADVLPGAGRTRSVTPIRYRPGQRHVLRYELCEPGGDAGTPGIVFAKLYEDDRGRRSFDVATRVAECLESRGEGLTGARPLAYLADDGAVLYSSVAGVPLSEHIRRGRSNGARRLPQAGSTLRALHSAPVTLAEGLEQHEFSAEVRATARASEHVDALLPSTGARISEILERAQSRHDRLPQEAPTFTHGDFKADHLWAAPGRLTLIDFDRCRLGDPAADVGKLLADLRWWYATSGRPGLEQAQRQFLDGYLDGATPERMARARLYEAMLLAKIAVRRVRLFDPNWAGRTDALIASAKALLT